jgi:hypothetical protein
MSSADNQPSPDLSARGPLKIGVLLDSEVNDAWVFSILEAIAVSDYATLSLVILNGAPSQRLNFWQKMQARWQRGLFNRYCQLDYRRYQTVPDAFEEKDCSPLFVKSEVRTVTPIQKKFSDRFPDADVEYVRSLGLDVLIRFGFRIVKGDILKAARFGMWSHHHGDNDQYRGAAHLFWEIYERNPISGCILQVLNENLDGGVVLYKSWSSTRQDSLYLNRNQVLWKSTLFVPRCLKALHEGGWERLAESKHYGESGPYSKPIYKAPKLGTMIVFLTRRAIKALENRITKVLRSGDTPHWFIAYRKLKDNAPWQLLAPPHDRFFADPFLIEADGRNFLFFEDYLYEKEKGVISYVELLEDGTTTELKIVLECDYHLSYPFMFEHAGTRYMIPETMDANRIELYRAVSFPDQWELDRILIDNIRAVDSTIVEHDGLHWLFCNIEPEGASSSEELFIFYSESGPLGPWNPHQQNPVISDIRQSRPAGNFYLEGGQLIRPSQDCSVRYGYGLNLNRVDCLTKTTYRETLIKKITPDWFSNRCLATHTLNRNQSFEVLDVQMYLKDLRAVRPPRSSVHPFTLS